MNCGKILGVRKAIFFCEDLYNSWLHLYKDLWITTLTSDGGHLGFAAVNSARKILRYTRAKFFI